MPNKVKTTKKNLKNKLQLRKEPQNYQQVFKSGNEHNTSENINIVEDLIF